MSVWYRFDFLVFFIFKNVGFKPKRNLTTVVNTLNWIIQYLTSRIASFRNFSIFEIHEILSLSSPANIILAYATLSFEKAMNCTYTVHDNCNAFISLLTCLASQHCYKKFNIRLKVEFSYFLYKIVVMISQMNNLYLFLIDCYY